MLKRYSVTATPIQLANAPTNSLYSPLQYYVHPRSRNASRSTPGGAYQPSTPYRAPMPNATSLFPYGIRSGVDEPALACAIPGEYSVRTGSDPGARRGPVAFSLSVFDRPLPALRSLPREGAPAVPPLEFVASPCPA